jgi:hypothetical protein
MRDFIGSRRTRSESDIVKYLRSGHMLVGVMEWLTDCIDGSSFVEGSGAASPLTDGTWIWRQDLAYYVEKYHISLADNFVAHMVEVKFEIPELRPQELSYLADMESRHRGENWWALP